MGSVSHQLNYGMLGKETPKLINELPRRSGPYTGINEPDLRSMQYGAIKGTDDPLRTIDGLINGGVRGVMPCCGIKPTMVSGSRVLRHEPLPSSGSMVVPQGAFKSEMSGLASLATKPLNRQPQVPRDFCFPDLFVKTPQPPFQISR